MIDLSEIDVRLELCRENIYSLAEEVSAFLTRGMEIRYTRLGGFGEGWIRIKEDVPIRFRVQAGGIIHELRACLDSLVCRLAISNGRTENGNWFPICNDEDDFNTAGLEKIRKLSADHKNIIRTYAPYGPEKWRLRGMHKFDCIQKHRRLGAAFLKSGGLSFQHAQISQIQFLDVPLLTKKWKRFVKIWPGTEFKGHVTGCLRFSEPDELAGREFLKEIREFQKDVVGIVNLFRV